MERIVNSFLLILLVGVTACGSDSDDEAFTPFAGSNKLKRVLDPLEFEQSYKNSLINYYKNQQFSAYYTDVVQEGDVANSSSSSASSPEGGNSPIVSETNLQEQGVDEADRIKTDGESLFVLQANTNNYYPVGSPSSSSAPNDPALGDEGETVKVFKLHPDESDLQLVTEVDLYLAENMSADGLYLYNSNAGKSLVVTAKSGASNYGWYDSTAWSAGTASISLMDVEDPVAANITNKITVEGNMISSRRIGHHLLVASRFHPNIDNIHFYAYTEAEKAHNKSVIEGFSLGDLLPKVTNQNGQSESLVTPEDCFIADVDDSAWQVADVISVYAVNLSDLSISSSLCYVGATEAFYASTDAVFLATTRYQWVLQASDVVDYQGSTVETDLHEFTFENGVISYQASGSVDGHLGWNAKQRPFRLSARNGDLRVVSYTAELDVNKSPVKLSVLRKKGSELQLLAALPNSLHPEPLGKPGESLYASRFVGDKAYFVTFRTTDPLYVIDLSNPEDPRRLGELHVDGYSDYLHPVGENLLIGLGKDAIADQAGGDGRGAWFQGVKLSLIDVADPANPLEVDKLVFGRRGSESAALYDHHAFTYLSADQTGAGGRLAIPMQLNAGVKHQDESAPWVWHEWQGSGLQLVEVDELNKVFSVQSFIQTADPSEQQYAPNFNNDRAVLLDDAVYYIQENHVFSTDWFSQERINGPR